MQKLNTTTSSSVVTHLKSIFARFGIPTTLIFDNGPQFDSQEMKEFSQSYGFQRVTISPYYPQANGLAERTVKTVKRLIEHSSDPYRALLSYRATPIPWCALSPAELLMGWKIRTDIPQSKDKLISEWSHIKNFKSLDKRYKASQKKRYDQRHRVRSLPLLPEDQPVWVETRGRQVPGRISDTANTPRSYIIETASGQVWRNRTHLRTRSDLQENTSIEPTSTSRVVTRSQTGTTIHPPDHLTY